MNDWTLWQFYNVVCDFLGRCDDDTSDAVIARLALLLKHGNMCRRPVTAYLGDGIFELRASSRTAEPRLLFYFDPGKEIIFVHAIFKTTSKTPRSAIDQAIRNRRIIQRGGRTHGFTLPN